jgi:hypothetical protein
MSQSQPLGAGPQLTHQSEVVILREGLRCCGLNESRHWGVECVGATFRLEFLRQRLTGPGCGHQALLLRWPIDSQYMEELPLVKRGIRPSQGGARGAA